MQLSDFIQASGRSFQSLDEPLIPLALDTGTLAGPLARDKLRNLTGARRDKVFMRHRGRCAICGEIAINLHHIGAYEEGGPTMEENLIPLCGICHDFAPLGVWPRTFLWTLACSGTFAFEDGEPLSEEAFRGALMEAMTGFVDWRNKVRVLLTLWRKIPVVRSCRDRKLELSARIQWDLSAILSTHGNEGAWEVCGRNYLPLNRILGLLLAGRALSAAKLIERSQPTLGSQLRLGTAHSRGVHFRSLGKYEDARVDFYRHCPQFVTFAEKLQPDPVSRAYWLVAHAIDLVRVDPFKPDEPSARAGRLLADKCRRWAESSGQLHAFVDTVLRQAETRIFSGMFDEGFSILHSVKADAEKLIPIIRVISRKIEMLGLAHTGDREGAGKLFQEAYALAEKYSLDDQRRKIVSAYANFPAASSSKCRTFPLVIVAPVA